MKLTKATLKRLIKEELDAMQEMQEPSEEAIAIIRGLMDDLEQMKMIKQSEVEDYTDEDDNEAFKIQAEKTLQALKSEIMPALQKMIEDPAKYKERGMI
jgi:DNA polymerase III delta subunit